ncbi:MAG TPA: type II toxin-antitoxin system VapC family toxin [Longimicrobium sp.]|nr:type II toxin-antitoxin system VapC family toxin [Longimicrobium sp.]
MSLLLDTHAFLWFIEGDPRLSRAAAERIADPETRVCVSVVSAWEIVIKQRTGKLELGQPIAEWWTTHVAANAFEVLPITEQDVLAVDPLPLHHRDPFDRVLVAQALTNGLSLVSADAAFAAYPVACIW